MHYYAIINEEYCVMEVVSSDTVIDDPTYIELTEEQYNDESILGSFYDQDKNEFVGFIVWAGTTNEIRYDETYRTLTAKLNEMDAEIATHTHNGYASSDDLAMLTDIVNTKADENHLHENYADVNHGHSEYATQVSLDTLGEIVNGKADSAHTHTEYALATHSHDDYAAIGHEHDSSYAPLSHSHNDYVATIDFEGLEAEVDGKADASHTHNNYAETTHDHDSDYADISHNHDSSYSVIGHNHDNYATITDLASISVTVAGKADESHNHDDVYYTEDEIDAKLADKANATHNHAGVYDASGSAANALTSANAYTDSKIDALVGEGAATTLDTIGEISAAIGDNQDAIDLLNSAIANKANVSDLNAHASDTEIHITDAERAVWNSKSNFSGNYNDLANKPVIPSIEGLASEDYVDEKVGAITVESIGALPNTTVIPTVPTNVSAFTNDAGYLTEHQSLNGFATETYVDAQISAIDIPDALSDLTADSTHRTVTDAEKAAWNAKSNFSGSYNDLTNKPTIPSISGLATETYVDEAVSGKADAGHNHNDIYYTETEIDTLLSNKSNSNHNHNSSYDALGTAQTKANEVQANLDEAIDEFTTHAENADIHFTVAERNKLNGIAANANNYTHPNSGVTAGTYKSVTVNAQGHVTGGTNPTTLAGYGITDAETKGAANTALVSAKEYTDDAIADEVANRDSAIATAKSSAISTAASDATTKIASHNTSTSAHNDIRVLIADLTTKLNNFLDVDDTTTDQLSEVLVLIENNKGTLESLTTGKINTSDIVNNLTTNSMSKVLSAAQGVAIKSLIDALQTELDDGFEEITSEKIRTLFSN